MQMEKQTTAAADVQADGVSCCPSCNGKLAKQLLEEVSFMQLMSHWHMRDSCLVQWRMLQVQAQLLLKGHLTANKKCIL